MDRLRNLEQDIPELLARIPGYRGYRSKEDRRDADKRLRDEIVAKLEGYTRRLERVAAMLADRRELMGIGPVDQLVTSLRLLGDRVRTASYGYGGLFSDRNVDDAALDQLHQFDSRLLEATQQLEGGVAAVGSADDNSSRAAAVEEARKTVDSLQDLFRTRSEVVESGQPRPLPPPPSPLEALQPAEDTEPKKEGRPLPNLGDALSLGGENFVVDAVIDVESAEPMRLVRIATSPQRWLLLGSSPTAPTADLTRSPHPSATIGTGEQATANVVGLSGKSGRQPVSLMLTRGEGDGSVRLRLDWGSDQLVLAGSEIEYEEIELYGSAQPR
jgi:hypothetical protein